MAALKDVIQTNVARPEEEAFVEGYKLCFGEGAEVDFGTAINNFKSAVECGRAAAAALIGRMYHRGDGIPASHETALKWLEKARDMGLERDAENGDPYAQYVLG